MGECVAQYALQCKVRLSRRIILIKVLRTGRLFSQRQRGSIFWQKDIHRTTTTTPFSWTPRVSVMLRR